MVAFFLLLVVSAVVMLPEPSHALVDPPGSYKDGTKVQAKKVKKSDRPASDDTIVDRIIKQYESKAKDWRTVIAGLAEKLLFLFAIFEVCWIGIRLGLGRENPGDAIKQFVMFILMAGFFLAVIRNYEAWSSNLIQGLANIGSGMGASAQAAQDPFGAGLKIVTAIWNELDAFDPVEVLGMIITGLIVLVCFALITARMIIIKCEAAVAMAASLLLIAFGGSSMFKEYAINSIRYVLAVAFKLFTLQMLMAIGMEFISEFEKYNTSLADLMVLISACIVLVALVNTLPDTVGGIVTGSNLGGSSGVGMGAAAGVVTGAAVGAAAGIGGAMAAGSAMNSASKLATLAGATGLGKIGHMAKNLMSAGSEAQKTGGTRSSIMKERLDTAMQKNKGDT